MRLLSAPAATVMLLCVGACEDPAEWRSRQAVQGLVKATSLQAPAALERVRRGGADGLMDIEQAFHGASLATRLRLLEAIEAIGDREAVPLLRFLERWDEDSSAQARARQVRQALEAQRYPRR